MLLICIWTASILIEHQIHLCFLLFPDDNPKMNKTLSVFYCQLSGALNVTLKSLLLILNKDIRKGIEEFLGRFNKMLSVTAWFIKKILFINLF